MTTDKGLVPIELIQSKIIVLRDEKVMIHKSTESGSYKKQKAIPI